MFIHGAFGVEMMVKNIHHRFAAVGEAGHAQKGAPSCARAVSRALARKDLLRVSILAVAGTSGQGTVGTLSTPSRR